MPEGRRAELPSLPVGLLTLVAQSSVMQRHSSPGIHRLKSVPLVLLRQGCLQDARDIFSQSRIRILMTKLVEIRQLRHPLVLRGLLLWIASRQRDRSRISINHFVDDFVDTLQGGFALRALGLIGKAFAEIIRETLVRTILISQGQVVVS